MDRNQIHKAINNTINEVLTRLTSSSDEDSSESLATTIIYHSVSLLLVIVCLIFINSKL
jgi:hypothetical protein